MKFEKELIKLGFTESRVVELTEGLDNLHRALCKLDSSNISLVADNGGVEGLLKKFAEVEEVVDITKEFKKKGYYEVGGCLYLELDT